MIGAFSVKNRDRGLLPSTAQFLSNIISPPVVAAIFGFLIAGKEHPLQTAVLLGALNGVFMCLAPLLLVAYLLKTGRIHDMHMSLTPHHRRLPYLAAFLCALLAFAVFSLRGDSPLLRAMAACNALSLATLWLINNYWLVSNHTASIMHAAVFGAYTFGLGTGLWSLPVVGVVVWARWLLRKHTPAQLAAGLLVGAVPVVLLAGLGWFNF